MFDRPQDHEHAGAISHDYPSPPCPGNCGWSTDNCHCLAD